MKSRAYTDRASKIPQFMGCFYLCLLLYLIQLENEKGDKIELETLILARVTGYLLCNIKLV